MRSALAARAPEFVDPMSRPPEATRRIFPRSGAKFHHCTLNLCWKSAELPKEVAIDSFLLSTGKRSFSQPKCPSHTLDI